MATSNKNMNDMMRQRRKEMVDLPAYEGPAKADVDVDVDVKPESEEESSKFTVAAPGEKSTGEQFEYEPMVDIPGAWVVYPPGVPCDDTEYRIQMDAPAGKDDFDKMQQALDDAGDTTRAVASTGPATPPADEEGAY